MDNLYHTDYYRWATRQTELLKAGHLNSIDKDLLAAELRKLAQGYEQELQKRFAVLLTDLLVWQYEYDFRSYPQKCRIDTHRENIKKLLNEEPSLKNCIPKLFTAAYEEAVYEAAIRTAYWFTDFHTGLWSVEDVLNNNFWPELWPENAAQESGGLRQQPWFRQEIQRALAEREELPSSPPLKKAL
ncbi:MAG: DUF29 domain-containing protein [Endozoicomonas sp.]|uniref:DUF29 domain-containing protein n=1 Tax=Endozoicomonas sp. TaxID=1892382 RepID=UPI003D9BA9DC